MSKRQVERISAKHGAFILAVIHSEPVPAPVFWKNEDGTEKSPARKEAHIFTSVPTAEDFPWNEVYAYDSNWMPALPVRRVRKRK